MAQLTAEQRRALWADYMRQNDDPIGVTKPDLRAAGDALDAFFDANMIAINQAIPQPARSGLTARQKARLLMAVIAARFRGGL